MILYKYYPVNEYSFKSLAVNGLWCHHAQNMNDPFECLWLAKRDFSPKDLMYFKNGIKNDKNSQTNQLLEQDDKSISLLINTYREHLLNRFAFCALSETYDNILMWSHYASSHSGFVIGIEFQEKNIPLQKVEYLDTLPNLNMSKLVKLYKKENIEVSYWLKDLSVKSIDWNYEKEWRIWINRPGYYKYSRSQIKELYFGVNCSTETKAIVLKLLADVEDSYIHKFNEMEFQNNPVRLIP